MRRWPLVAAAALVVGLAVLAVVALRRDDPAPPVAASADRLSLPLPATAGGWQRVEDDATARMQRAFQQSVDQRVGDVDVAVALYEREDGDRFRVTALVPHPGGTTSRSLRADPDSQLRDFLTGAGVQRPGPVDGGTPAVVMMCGRGADPGPACGWADRWALALVSYGDPGITRDQAAAETRRLRADLSH